MALDGFVELGDPREFGNEGFFGFESRDLGRLAFNASISEPVGGLAEDSPLNPFGTPGADTFTLDTDSFLFDVAGQTELTFQLDPYDIQRIAGERGTSTLSFRITDLATGRTVGDFPNTQLFFTENEDSFAGDGLGATAFNDDIPNIFLSPDTVFTVGLAAGSYQLLLEGGRDQEGIPTDDYVSTNYIVGIDTGRAFSGEANAFGEGPRIGSVTLDATTQDVSGTAGDDVRNAPAGPASVNLGEGLDTYVVDAVSPLVTVQINADDVYVDDGFDTDVLVGVERIALTDGTLALDVEAGENAGSAYRIYQAAFDRVPDDAGLSFWIETIDSGVSLNAVAQGFVDSPEFQSVYGVDPSNLAFVDTLYQNILQRSGEAQGVEFWTGVLDSGSADKGDVLAGFSESPENIALVAPAIEDGIFYG